jgi:hypothetical protein
VARNIPLEVGARDAALATDVHDGQLAVADLTLERAHADAAECGGGFVEGEEEGEHAVYIALGTSKNPSAPLQGQNGSG